MKNREEYRIKYETYRTGGQIEFVTFHPSYSYEDFIESIRPTINGGDIQKFEYHNGIFKKICLNALIALAKRLDLSQIDSWKSFKENRRLFKEKLSESLEEDEDFLMTVPRYVLIIDEINRGDVSKIFGELITLIEDDKRIGMSNELIVKLPYSQEDFGIPPNLYIIGTMNTADKSLTSIDIALRRRFHFEEMAPDLESLYKTPEEYGCTIKNKDALQESITAVISINKKLSQNLDIGRDKRIGHAFFCNIKEESQIKSAWKNKIWPLLEEYYYFDKEALKALSSSVYTPENGWESDKLETFIKKMNEQVKN